MGKIDKNLNNHQNHNLQNKKQHNSIKRSAFIDIIQPSGRIQIHTVTDRNTRHEEVASMSFNNSRSVDSETSENTDHLHALFMQDFICSPSPSNDNYMIHANTEQTDIKNINSNEYTSTPSRQRHRHPAGRVETCVPTYI